jgi:PKD repeat protein
MGLSKWVLFRFAIVLMAFLFCNISLAAEKNYIVVFSASVAENQKKDIVESVGGIIIKDLGVINAKSIKLAENKIQELTKSPGVIRIDIDDIIKLDTPINFKSIPQSPQFIPWGVERLDAKSLASLVITKVNIAIMDTGIDLAHPDLKDNIVGGVNIINPGSPPIDMNGHGTHIAGILAAADNEIGVLGVAPKASLYAVKVFNDIGNPQPIASVSDIIAGLEWCIRNNIQAVNMSFSSYIDNKSLQDAIANTIKAGVMLVASAGNNGSSKPTYPASYPGVISVCATDAKDNRTNWSNSGPDIDLSAPGVDIPSTYINGGYALLSGTDIATPHVTGTLALALAAKIKLTDVEKALFDKADDLGDRGKDDLYGYGLVNAKKTAYYAWWLNPMTVTATAKPIAGFVPLAVVFSATVVGGPPVKPTFYKWDFDGNKKYDKTSVISPDETHIYTNEGIYRANIEVTDFLGKTAVSSVIITVKIPFTVEALADPIRGYAPLNVNLSAKITGLTKTKSYEWDFESDGNYDYVSSTTPDITHEYAAGVHKATIKVTDIYGNFVTASTVDIDVKPPLVVTAIANPFRGYFPLSVQLLADVTGGSGTIASYEWDFNGDGTFDSSNSETPDSTFEYKVTGIYKATIKVTDGWGGTATGSVDINVKPPLAVTAIANPNQGPAPLNVRFTVNISGGSGTIALYEWDFDGDGTYDPPNSSIPDVTHEYGAVGIYKAKVRVTDDWGGTATNSVDIDVKSPLTVKAMADNTSGYYPMSVNLWAIITNTGSGTIVSYEWDFNNDGIYDSYSAVSSNANYTYKSAGTFKATVKVVDDHGAIATDSIEISTQRPPYNIKAVANPNIGYAPLIVAFSAILIEEYVEFEWDWESDGTYDWNSVVSANTTHKYDQVGTYTVTLRAKQISGTVDTSSITITVQKALKAIPSANPISGYKPLVVTFTPRAIDFSGTVIDYAWDYDGDGYWDWNYGRADVSSYVFGNSGTYNAVLKVTDTNGFTDQASITIIVKDPFPLADAQVSPNNGQAPLAVNLAGTGSSSNGRIVLYEWDFDGDGTYDWSGVSNGITQHTYTEVGVYNPVFGVTDSIGLKTTVSLITNQVRVGPAGSPTAEASANPRSGNAPLMSNLTGIGTDPSGSIVKYEWDFENDGTFEWSSQSTGNTSHLYEKAGKHIAAFRVTDNDGLTAFDLVTVTVNMSVSLSITDDTISSTKNETTFVRTTISADAIITIFINDQSDNIVRTLVDNVPRLKGSYSDVWDGKDSKGTILEDGVYYAVMQYNFNGEIATYDLTHITGNSLYEPSQNYMGSDYGTTYFDPHKDESCWITFNLNKASEVSIFVGHFNYDIRERTILNRQTLGSGQHSMIWDGFNDKGKLAQSIPIGESWTYPGFLIAVWAWTLPSNAIFLEGKTPTLNNVSVEPNYFDPSERTCISTFDPKADISYNISKPCNVILKIYNINTNILVRTIQNYNVLQGKNVISWNGTNESGLYVDNGDYRLSLVAIDSTGVQSLLMYGIVKVFY